MVGRGDGRNGGVFRMNEEGSRKQRRARQKEGRRQNKNDGGDEGTGFGMTAGHGTEHQGISGFVAAAGGSVRRTCRLSRLRIATLVSVGRTHSSGTAISAVGLPRGSPNRRPQQQCCQQTHPRSHFSPRSERKLVHGCHLLNTAFYTKRDSSGHQGFTNFCKCGISKVREIR